MKCIEVEQIWVSGAGLEDPAVTAHLERCSGCQELYGPRSLPEQGRSETSADLGALRAAVMADVSADRHGLAQRLRSWPTRQRLGLIAVAACSAIVYAALRPRSELHAYPETRLWLTLALGSAVAAGLMGLCVRPLSRPRVPGAAVWLAFGGALPWLLAALPAAQTGHPDSLLGAHDSVAGRAVSCLALGALLSVPFLGLWRAVDRLQGRDLERSIAAVTAAGLLGNLALQLHCPLTSVSHLLLGHAPLALVLGLGWWVQGKALRQSAGT